MWRLLPLACAVACAGSAASPERDRLTPGSADSPDESSCADTGTGDPAFSQRISARLDQLHAAHGALALNVVVSAGDDAWAGARGLTAVGGDAVTACDSFRIYSVTKTYTAALVLLLVANGQLGLDDTVDRW